MPVIRKPIRILAPALGAALLMSLGVTLIPSPAHSPAPAAARTVAIPVPEPKLAYEASTWPAPSGPRNLLESADGSLRVQVGSYTDCSGASAVPRYAAELDPCFAGRYYFLGHNPGVFTPLMHMAPGDRITYHDAGGHALRFRIVDTRVIARNGGGLTLPAGVAAQFQTCEVLDGAYVRILDAVRDTA
ncbi:MAG TPA: hypothetical protein VIO84_11550 [Candidatus Dormibacteraeota bacterium]